MEWSNGESINLVEEEQFELQPYLILTRSMRVSTPLLSNLVGADSTSLTPFKIILPYSVYLTLRPILRPSSSFYAQHVCPIQVNPQNRGSNLTLLRLSIHTRTEKDDPYRIFHIPYSTTMLFRHDWLVHRLAWTNQPTIRLMLTCHSLTKRSCWCADSLLKFLTCPVTTNRL